METTNMRVLFDPAANDEKVRNAGAYVRVSTRSDKQQHSYASQKEYWRSRIESDPKLNFVGIWADDGISGKSMRKRKAFIEMIECAKAGGVEVIFVKSVSRFGRNFFDVVKTIKDLRVNHGVAVYFEEENIWSTDKMADTILSMRAMLAEQELKDMSDNMKWAIRARFKKCVLNNNGRTYGFALEDDGTGVKRLVPIPAEAEVVRFIYGLYLNGSGVNAIAKELMRCGVPTAQGKTLWRPNVIRAILGNEKHMGDAIMQKIITVDYKPLVNRDADPAAPRIYIEDDHEPIVDKETWYRAQELLRTRANEKLMGKTIESRVFTGVIECGECGTNYRHKVYQYRGKGLYGLWACGKYLSDGKSGCGSRAIKESVLHELFVSAFNEFVDTRPSTDAIKALDDKLKSLRERLDELIRLRDRYFIDELSFTVQAEETRRQMLESEREIAVKSQDNMYKAFKKKTAEYEEANVTRFLQKAIVREWTVAFVFKNGVTITRPYTNGAAGNKPGWVNNALARNYNVEDNNDANGATV